MGLRLYGIGAAECPDNVGETILLDGLETSRLQGVRDEHDDDSFFAKIGAVTYHKKIKSEEDCENEKQLRCWRHARVPFLYAEAELADDTDHPNAAAAAAMIKFASRPDIPLNVGFSIDGGIIERRTRSGQPTEDKEAGKILARTLATDLAVTVKPCNPKCVLFIENDLTKSDLVANPDTARMVLERLKKSRMIRSFRETKEGLRLKLLMDCVRLKKSLDDYFSAMTSMRCFQCGAPVRFFKASSSIPNGCYRCGSSFSMLEIWRALNK